MSTATLTPPATRPAVDLAPAPGGRTAISPMFENAQQWLASLGGVPLDRVIFNPWPGTATEADLLLFVERDGRLCELIDGTLVEKPMGADESLVATNISYCLNEYVEPRELGVVLGSDATLRMPITNRIREPDVSFITSQRWEGLPAEPRKVPIISPDLAVEVLSDSNTNAEMRQKRIEYFGSGTRLAWVVDPVAMTVTVYSAPDAVDRVLNISDNIDGGDVLPGMVIPVARFFRRVRPRTR